MRTIPRLSLGARAFTFLGLLLLLLAGQRPLFLVGCLFWRLPGMLLTFVHGVCSRCGAEAGGGALPGVADGYEVTNQGKGDEDDNNDEDEDEVEDDDDDDVVTVAYIHGEGPALPALEEATSIVSASDRATLMHERKLILILFRLDINDLGMLVKLRAFARGFLEQANAIFEMHVYTLGSRVYVRAAVGLLDPDGVYIGGRIVSRNESTKQNKKSLDAIQGADPAMVVILDDTDGVWPWHPENLILMDRYQYHCFASTCRTFDYDIPSLAEQGLEENEQDGSLAVVLGVLQRIHQGFFDGHRADVREVIAEVRSQVLPGCTVAFSFLAQVMEDYPEATLTWRLAEALGAVCRKDVDEEVTRVVAEDPAAEKAQWARDNGKFLVNTEWVKAASFRWCRQDELAFPVKFLNLP